MKTTTKGHDLVYPNGDHNENKLAKRELFAAMAMQGILMSGEAFVTYSCDYIAAQAAQQADALISELNKEVQS